MIYVDQIDDEFVEEVESECTLGSGAWDMVDPREIIAAAINVAERRELIKVYWEQ